MRNKCIQMSLTREGKFDGLFNRKSRLALHILTLVYIIVEYTVYCMAKYQLDLTALMQYIIIFPMENTLAKIARKQLYRVLLTGKVL